MLCRGTCGCDMFCPTSSQGRLTGGNRLAGDVFDGFNRWGSVLFPGLVALEDVHGQIVVATVGEWGDALQHDVVDAELQKVKRVEDGFHQLCVVVEEPRELLP